MTVVQESSGIERKLSELRAAHRALDARIEQLVRDNFPDQIEMQRLKKQKLALKDVIVRLESHLLPDIIA
ncbi:MAG: YdcH family protein [Geminicoccaceae bacterium]